jgi:hypothetical protein
VRAPGASRRGSSVSPKRWRAAASTRTSGSSAIRRSRESSAGENALVIAREDPGEFIAQFDAVFARAKRVEAMRRSGLRTARQYTWQRVLERHLLPCIGAFDGLARDALRVA